MMTVTVGLAFLLVLLGLHTSIGRLNAYYQAYAEGEWAAKNGLPPDANPYTSKMQIRAWYAGWRDSYEERTGQSSRTTGNSG